MELSNTIHTQCTRKRTLNAIIHTAIHNVHSHTSHSHNKFKQTRDRQQHPGPLMAILPLLSFTEKYWRSQKIWYVYCPLQWLALSWIYPLSWVSLWVSSRTHSFVMGRTSSESRSRTRAERTRSSCPLYVSMMRPTGQLLRGVLFAITRTKSFSWTFLWVPCHWVRWMRDDRYSLVHRFQNTSARYCTWRHFFLWNMSFSLNNPGGMLAGRWISRWLGVSGSRSLGSSEIGVSGLLFTIPSAITNNVVSISLVGTCSVIIANRTRRTVLICRSQTPPMCDAAGGLNIQRMPRCPKTSCILSWFHASSSFLSSRSAPTKFVPLSDRISLGLSSSCYESVQTVYKGICIHSFCSLYMYCPSGKTGEQATISFLTSPAPFDRKGPKVVNSYIGERRFVQSYSIWWEVSFLLLTWPCISSPTRNTGSYNSLDQRRSSYDPIFLT